MASVVGLTCENALDQSQALPLGTALVLLFPKCVEQSSQDPE